MKKSNLLPLCLLALLLLITACQSKGEQTIGNTEENPTKNSTEQSADNLNNNLNYHLANYRYHNEENTFKRTVSIGRTEIILPLPGLFLNKE
jgi:cyclopropane fatty-acyl-phospholipid synthase-like methyltransferase